jgi:hypothetical protein
MYKLVNNPFGGLGGIQRLTDMANIPLDEANGDYQAYLKWLDGYEYNGVQYIKVSEGNTPEPADPLPQPESPPNDIETLRQLITLLEQQQSSNTSGS